MNWIRTKYWAVVMVWGGFKTQDRILMRGGLEMLFGAEIPDGR